VDPFWRRVHQCIVLYFAQMESKAILHTHFLRNFEWSLPEDVVRT